MKIRLEANGRILLPAEVRKQLGVEPGDTLLLDCDADGVRVWTPAIAAARAQEWASTLAPPASLADELIAERRAEASREAREEKSAGKPRSRARR